jgi:hypothetical protein
MENDFVLILPSLVSEALIISGSYVGFAVLINFVFGVEDEK